jgi:hypothetical protein
MLAVTEDSSLMTACTIELFAPTYPPNLSYFTNLSYDEIEIDDFYTSSSLVCSIGDITYEWSETNYVDVPFSGL